MFELFFNYSRATFANGAFFFASGWPVWLLILIALLGTAGLVLSLLRRRETLSPWKLGILAVLQGTMLSGLLALLWQPSLSTEQLRARDNALAIALDTSASMSYGEGGQSRLQQAVSALDGNLLGELDPTLGVRLYAFAEGSLAIDSLADVPAPG
ncbi:MAG TPA: hypothetical protein VLD39_01085, partial [Gammaproteobacteria bacterium]|nr:hypothetical protein [Gammaproteobacteria bacterium]